MKQISGYTVAFYTLSVLSLACFAVWTIGQSDVIVSQGAVSSPSYPNSTLTPGVIATSDFKTLMATKSCGTYSQCHRVTSQKLKDTVCHEYYKDCKGMEIDHLVPLALGGADDIKNLWPQIGEGQWDFHAKDKLETYLVSRMKAGTITPKDAQKCIRQDWVSCYQHSFKSPLLGAIGPVTDLDDDIL